jgi:hypothetical protein
MKIVPATFVSATNSKSISIPIENLAIHLSDYKISILPEESVTIYYSTFAMVPSNDYRRVGVLRMRFVINENSSQYEFSFQFSQPDTEYLDQIRFTEFVEGFFTIDNSIQVYNLNNYWSLDYDSQNLTLTFSFYPFDLGNITFQNVFVNILF